MIVFIFGEDVKTHVFHEMVCFVTAAIRSGRVALVQPWLDCDSHSDNHQAATGLHLHHPADFLLFHVYMRGQSLNGHGSNESLH